LLISQGYILTSTSHQPPSDIRHYRGHVDGLAAIVQLAGAPGARSPLVQRIDDAFNRDIVYPEHRTRTAPPSSLPRPASSRVYNGVPRIARFASRRRTAAPCDSSIL